VRPRVQRCAGRKVIARTLRVRDCVAGCLAALALSGCSVSMPLSPFGKNGDDVTGSIAKSNPLSRALDSEDWRRAKAALSTALDPQGNGETVNWDNPQTGAKGSFVAVAQAYPADDGICRAFISNISAKEAAESLQGTACRDKLGEWSLSDVRPWKRANSAS
jgi:surface antigen